MGLAEPAPATLALRDGSVFRGFAAGAAGWAEGEVVFNTSMSGYQEIVTDPSYHGQIVVLTVPHVGNVGVNDDDDESDRVWVRGLVVADLALVPSNWRARGGLLERLADAGVPVAWGVDTRALVLHLRRQGALPGVLSCGGALDASALAARAARARGTDGCDLTGDVSCKAVSKWVEGPWRGRGEEVGAGPWPESLRRAREPGPRVVVVDCGVKRSILRRLVGEGAEVVVVPPATPAATILGLAPAGVVLSNGPGDPAAVAHLPETIRRLLGSVPILGICLGHQLLAVALGGRTYKLPFGHHGANHPVRDAATGAVWITAQNHNYAVEASSLPAAARVTMTNLTDGSVEGLAVDDLAAEGVQFHPEAGPGPHDALEVLARFLGRCREGNGA